VAESDEQRFDRLYRQHFTRVAAYLLARTDRDSAADALARTFEITWRRMADVPGEPLPWLLGVARRVLSEQRRAQGRRGALIERIAETASETSHDDTTATAVRERVVLAIGDLTPLQQEALLLTVWDGLSEREAATALRCSRGAIALRLHRARKQLRAALEQVPPKANIADDRSGDTAPRRAVCPSTKEAI
jgi:RNA polymerase sigma-70 factor, ECF subfamily